MMARLLSVNVGLPREITWRGQTVRAAIWKDPVHGKRVVRRLDIEGDAQADLIEARTVTGEILNVDGGAHFGRW